MWKSKKVRCAYVQKKRKYQMNKPYMKHQPLRHSKLPCNCICPTPNHYHHIRHLSKNSMPPLRHMAGILRFLCSDLLKHQNHDQTSPWHNRLCSWPICNVSIGHILLITPQNFQSSLWGGWGWGVENGPVTRYHSTILLNGPDAKLPSYTLGWCTLQTQRNCAFTFNCSCCMCYLFQHVQCVLQI